MFKKCVLSLHFSKKALNSLECTELSGFAPVLPRKKQQKKLHKAYNAYAELQLLIIRCRYRFLAGFISLRRLTMTTHKTTWHCTG